MPKGVPNKKYTPEFKNLVSYTISDRPTLSMVTTMLDKAFERIPNGTNLILHSDQGWQYQHKQYQRMLHFKRELIDYLDYSNNLRIKAK